MSETPLPDAQSQEQSASAAGADASAAGADAAAPDSQPAASAPRSWSKIFNRRSFLAGALSGAAAVVAAACWGDESPKSPLATASPLNPPSPLPTPGASATPLEYRSYLPFAPRDGNPGMLPPEPTLAPTPSKTPRPKKTPTPEVPTDTPTPEATPFPPGPPSKLGVFVGHNNPQLFDLLATQGVSVVKTLELDRNFLAQIKNTSPKTQIVGRIDLPQLEIASLDPLPAARAFVDQLMAIADDPDRRKYVDGWEAYNEPIVSSAEEMKKLADFEAERTRLLAQRQLRSVIGNFGAGQPPMELWQYFLPAVQAAKENDGWLGLHEYSAPTMYYLTSVEGKGRYPGVTPADSGWLTLRYRKVYNDVLGPANLIIPLVMTELGVDGLVQPRPGPPNAKGWMDFQGWWAENGFGLWGPGAYVEQLVWYDDAMRQNDYVLGGCIFALAPTAGWESYNIQGPVAMVLQQYLSVHARS